MSLRRKLIFADAGLLVSLSLMIAGSLWGLLRQRTHVEASLAEYTALRQVESAEARYLLYRRSGRPEDLEAALLGMRQYRAVVSQYDTVLPPEISTDQRRDISSKSKVLLVGLNQLSSHGGSPVDDDVTAQFADLLSVCTGFVNRTNAESAGDLQIAVVGVSAVAGLTVLVAIASTFWHYRRLTVPLARLRDWCRRTAGGDFSTPYQPTADREFVDLGRDVNRMASDLSAFYHRLEEMVAAKSRQLAQSERLASVGYLAAGVAHEINTPLNVMSGYSELLIKRLRPTDTDAVRDLEVIRGEAFRCKQITEKLLSLARGTSARQAVSIAGLIADVAAMVRGLPDFRGKTIDVVVPPNDECDVRGNPTELKQVLLNLVVNAAEAIGDGAGRIVIVTERDDHAVLLTVRDEGKGMDRATLDRVFEPFFTAKRGVSNPGTGLGLSITHAIVTDHGGELSAHSDGPGHGSTFIIRLPEGDR